MNKPRTFEAKGLEASLLFCIVCCSNAVGAERYVNLTSSNPVPPYTSPGTAATQIQAAVNAALSGDTVHIAAGDYYEQVVLKYKNNVTLVGEPGTTLHAFAGMVETLRSEGWNWYPLVALYRSPNVVLSGLTIDGEQLASDYAWPPDHSRQTRLLGVYFLGSGGDVTNCTVRSFRTRDSSQGSDANGIQAFNPLSLGSPVTVRISDSVFENSQLPIMVRGDPGSYPEILRVTASIKGNTIRGIGPVSFFSFGIWVVDGVAGEISGNTITGFSGRTDWLSCGIAAYDAAAVTHGRFIPLQPLTFQGNTFSDNGQHLLIVGGNNARVVDNSFLELASVTSSWGAVALSGTNILAANNNFSDLGTGINLANESIGPSWPAVVPAANVSMFDNWFCNVTELLRVNPMVIGFQEKGTKDCADGPLNPVFQSIIAPDTNGAALTLRSWHGETVVIETSTNLVDWVAVYTNLMHLPFIEYKDPGATGKPQGFYRATHQ